MTTLSDDTIEAIRKSEPEWTRRYLHSMSCPYPEGCNCDARNKNIDAEWHNRTRAKLMLVLDALESTDRIITASNALVKMLPSEALASVVPEICGLEAVILEYADKLKALEELK